MTKSERLLFIISYLQNKGRSTVDELASECGVSHRTIYRDVNSLSLLNIPIIQNNGYRLISKSRITATNLNDSDVELLCYALRSNNLSNHAFFRRRFRVIENMVLDNIRSARSRHAPRLYFWNDKKKRPTEQSDDRLIAEFVKAIKRYRLVDIVTNSDTKEKFIRSIPLAVLLERGKIKLVFFPAGQTQPRSVFMSQILKVKELQGVFDPQELLKFRLSEIED